MRTSFKYTTIRRIDKTVEPDKKTCKYPVVELLVKYNAEIPSSHPMLKRK